MPQPDQTPACRQRSLAGDSSWRNDPVKCLPCGTTGVHFPKPLKGVRRQQWPKSSKQTRKRRELQAHRRAVQSSVTVGQSTKGGNYLRRCNMAHTDAATGRDGARLLSPTAKRPEQPRRHAVWKYRDTNTGLSHRSRRVRTCHPGTCDRAMTPRHYKRATKQVWRQLAGAQNEQEDEGTLTAAGPSAPPTSPQPA